MKKIELIEYAEKFALEKDEILPRDIIVKLLGIEPGSEEWRELGAAARRTAEKITGNRAYLWGAIGIDFAPCPMNCGFCSLGEEWGIVTDSVEYDLEVITDQVREYVDCGVRWIVLRTTQYYPIKELTEVIRAIKSRVKGNYEIGLNIGEFNLHTADMLYESGVDFIYHSLRLREGKDTKFDPQDRINTLKAVQKSQLKLVFLIEPIGEEHTNEEIADICLLAGDCDAIVSGAMARIPVEGTPLGGIPQISEERLAQIIAVTRLAYGRRVPDICVHPGTKLEMDFGANVTVVETGSVPRDNSCCSGGKWNNFDAAKAKTMFKDAGYEVFQTE